MDGRCAVVLGLTFLALLVASCGGGPAGPPDLIPVDKPKDIGGIVPFIEGVEFPEVITAGEVFQLRFIVSADANPGALQGRSENEAFGFVYQEVSAEGQPQLRVELLVGGPPRAGDLQTEYVLPYHIDQPGNYVLRVMTTTTRELGGTKFTYKQPGGEFYPDARLTYKELPFTVAAAAQ